VPKAVHGGFERSGLQDRFVVNTIWLAAFAAYCLFLLLVVAPVVFVLWFKLL